MGELDKSKNQGSGILKESNVKQGRYYVGYMDILGYKDFFKNHKSDTENFLITINEAFSKAIEDIKLYENNINSIDPEFKPEIRIFSDNILIALKCRKKNVDNYIPYMRLVKLMEHIQLLFITKYELVLRGSIAKGLFYIDEKMVFGEALIQAYEMEQKAVFPKIILERDEVEDIIKFIDSNLKSNQDKVFVLAVALKTSIVQDGDNSYFINYLSAYPKDGNYESVQLSNFFALKYVEPSIESRILTELNKENQDEQFEKHRNVLLLKIKEYGNYEDLLSKSSWDIKEVEVRRSVLLKYMWLVDYHNKACELIGLDQHKIAYIIRTDTRTHQPIVEVP